MDTIDYIILASVKNGVKKYTSIFKNCKKTNAGKFREHVNKLEDLSMITIDSSESWLKKDGVKFVEENILKIKEYWNSLDCK